MKLSFAADKPHFPAQANALLAPMASQTAPIGINERSDNWVYYASRVRPHYERMNRLIGQIGGLLILGQAKGCFDTYFEMSRTPKEQTAACLDDLNSVIAPAGAIPHLTHMQKQVLEELGITPEEVDTVFITHSHFDHLGNTDAFPHATFYIQERELSKWIWAMAQPEHMQWMMTGTDPSDILRAVELTKQGRLRCIDGPQEDVLPGIDLHVAFDSHTYGCMWVHVRNDLARQSQNGWVLAGDLVYVYDNLVANPKVSDGQIEGKLSLKAVGFAMGSNTNLITASDDMLKAVDYQVKRVIPIHEERLKDVFPSRISKLGLRVSELCLADEQASAVL